MIFENLCAKDDTSWMVQEVLLLYQVKLEDKTNELHSIDIHDDHIFTETAAPDSANARPARHIKQRTQTCAPTNSQ